MGRYRDAMEQGLLWLSKSSKWRIYADHLHGGTACVSPSAGPLRTPSLEESGDLPRLERGQLAHYATLMVRTPTNSDSRLGSRSSRSMLTTS
jgi:hypothetical protein